MNNLNITSLLQFGTNCFEIVTQRHEKHTVPKTAAAQSASNKIKKCLNVKKMLI